MMVLLSLWILGALIGIAAAQKKGWSTVTGVLAGVFLGPFAWLLFFVSGITGKEDARMRCPECREWMQADARRCPHCRQKLRPQATPTPASRARVVNGIVVDDGTEMYTRARR